MASYKNCLAVLLGMSLFISSSMSEAVVEESSCGFNDLELAPSERSPHEINAHYMWPNGQIPYVFTDGVEYGDKQLMENNMREIEQRSCFKFKKLYYPPSDKKYLEIDIERGAPSCAAGNRHRFSAYVTDRYLARKIKNAVLLKSEYKLTDKESCRTSEMKDMYVGGILHEMFHALGVGHTQRRRDRDNYVNVYYGNIQDPSQYDKCGDCKVYPDIPYECHSIMHYGSATLAKRPQDPSYPTMVAKDPKTCKIGRNGGKIATVNDWRLIKKIGNTVCGTGGSGGGGSTGQWGAWGNYGYCSGTCESASQRQRRSCVGGTGCRGSAERSVSCEKSGCEEKCEKGNNCSVEKCGRLCCKYGWWC